ncbi:DMT family transporter [Maribrevibacterium harenarium]|uniref:DMT family transporter n=1 Tax=Maribrevibacterium harenarium TaxID=2589817 RepID=A0A501WHZ4_9GAMM|nr:DMT family transporter [Maribrevibacterium harenarium]TPE47734.1 DMT family transporter [Maribrevibacterium harenarium]
MSISHLFLWLTAAIWGFAFVAQSVGMEALGPYGFNATRFTLAALSMLPLIYFLDGKKQHDKGLTLKAGLIAGSVLFAGATLQQIGLLYTTAANAGFITTTYMLIVPIAGLFLRHHIERQTWVGIILALVGLYVLTVGPNLTVQKGDAIEFLGAFFWAAHVLIVGHYSTKVPIVTFSVIQLVVVACGSWIMALAFETVSWEAIEVSWVAIAYAGIASSAIAYTLQTLGQKQVAPSSAALILSTEAVFAAIGGWWLMDETLSSRELAGCGLIFVGMMISQWPKRKRATSDKEDLLQAPSA